MPGLLSHARSAASTLAARPLPDALEELASAVQPAIRSRGPAQLPFPTLRRSSRSRCGASRICPDSLCLHAGYELASALFALCDPGTCVLGLSFGGLCSFGRPHPPSISDFPRPRNPDLLRVHREFWISPATALLPLPGSNTIPDGLPSMGDRKSTRLNSSHIP